MKHRRVGFSFQPFWISNPEEFNQCKIAPVEFASAILRRQSILKAKGKCAVETCLRFKRDQESCGAKTMLEGLKIDALKTERIYFDSAKLL